MATAVDGRLRSVDGGRTRAETVASLQAVDADVIGLDFSFSFPSWFVAGCAGIDEVWEWVASCGEEWLAACEPPFWGRRGRPRPPLPGPPLRRTEACFRGARSVFQIGGAGSVGTGSLRGMPFLTELRAAGYSIWPFDPWVPPVVAEVWPRACMGSVVKSSAPARRAHLGADVSGALLDAAARSEHAFDAACAALALSRWAPPTLVPDEVDRIEGRILAGVD